MTGRKRLITASFFLLLPSGVAQAQQCPLFSHPDRVEQSGNVRTLHCRCDDGFENRDGSCKKTPEMRADTPEIQLRRLRNEEAAEWYWLTMNEFDVMTAAFWAAYGYEPKGPRNQDPDVESIWREARARMGNLLRLKRREEMITHDKEIAQKRFDERTRNFTIARKGSYAIDVSTDTAKASIYPPTDFSLWTNDEQARENGRCLFVGSSARLICK